MAAGDKFLKIHSLLCTLEALLRIFSASGGCYFNDYHQLNISRDEDLTYPTRPPYPPQPLLHCWVCILPLWHYLLHWVIAS